MAEKSAIEWTDSTFNPWIGCTKISPACDHCYAETLMDKRHHRVTWGGDRVRTSASNWQQPVRWQKQAATFFSEHGRRRRVFCASLADVFDNQVPTEWRDDLWALIRDTPCLDWQLLTKRPQNIGKMLPAFWDGVKGHVWLGTTVEDQKRADQNIPHLLGHDSAVRFVSCEPMVGGINICWAMGHLLKRAEHYLRFGMIPPGLGTIGRLDWVIAGGESGAEARPTNPEWLRSLRDQCGRAGVPFLFKQWGEWVPSTELWADTPELMVIQSDYAHKGRLDKVHILPDMTNLARVGKKAAGRLLDGIEHNGFPEVYHG